MNVPRLRHWDNFYIFQENTWHLVAPEDVVQEFNKLAERYEIILDDIEEILSGYQRRADTAVYSGPDVLAERSTDTA